MMIWLALILLSAFFDKYLMGTLMFQSHDQLRVIIDDGGWIWKIDKEKLWKFQIKFLWLMGFYFVPHMTEKLTPLFCFDAFKELFSID